jgi:serine phosphatase RsbU (regulator of sigma subunit)
VAKLGHYLFVGTQLGLFVADARAENKNMVFYPVQAAMNQQVFGLSVYKNELLIGGGEQLAILSVPTTAINIQELVRSKVIKLNIAAVIGFAHSPFDSARVWVTSFNGLYSIRKENGKWKSEYAAPLLGVKIQSAMEAAPGKLWLGAIDNGVYHVDFKDSLLPLAKSPIIKQYRDNQGLKTLNYIEVFADTGIGCKASNQKGIFRYSALGDSFVTDSSFDLGFMQTVSTYGKLILDEKGDYWLIYTDTANINKMTRFSKSSESGKYIQADVFPPFMRVMDFLSSNIIADSFGIYWMAGEKGLIRYNSNEISFPSYDFKALIRQVKIGKDSSIYNGYDAGNTPVYKTPLKFKDNHLTFEFSAPVYDVHDQVFYRYALEGFDSTWSDWMREVKKEYTNLSEGEYNFRVYAKNVYLQTSQEAVFKFRILPPWYRTVWAYMLYAIALSGGIYGVILLQVARLRRQNRILEQKVAERTAEVVRQRDEIILQKEQISNAYEEIRAINDNLSDANIEIQRQKDEIQAQNGILTNAFEEIRAINESLLTANAEIEAQKKLVEDANHEITSSIEYARRIQDALLPAKTVLEKLFVESFIFYKPKSIVSGDFYWVYPNYAKEEIAPQYIYVAAADCTGHGVPGAFMSMLCSSLLNQTVQAQAGIRPEQMLSCVNTLLIQTLRQDREKIVRDGMDICLIRLEKIRTDPAPIYEVISAGANNPLYCVRKGDVTTFPVTKRPIGGGQFQETDFESYSFCSEPGDMLYLFSDGFADQFGGPHRRKYTYVQFRKLLVRISEFSADKQFDMIQEEFKNWQRHYEQLDDILVLGIRL